ncbi:hypothetical protein [Streptomyces yunnanensis]|uniref:DUF748 domain-containing protein n=1 Tax=Streptomyces yunnanensis TaxID=156453 RepID=A0A9X8N6N0_9ACTN|nr:hypothetical protein [Streptomyces yunnanensis]SHN16694.1 hypothetical protein SAMN05216268_12226 [Streptomyces yunnanensis]
MHTGLKVGIFAAALAATFGSAYGVGKAVGPVVPDAPAARHADHAAHDGRAPAAAAPGGLQIAEGGYSLDLKTPAVTAGTPAELRFAVVDDRTGRRVTAYRPEHGKELHFIVASRDLTVFRHLHPRRAADGTWSTPVDLPAAGGYRVFADFAPAGAKDELTLGADLAAAGTYRPAQAPRPAATAEVDGYRVTLDGALRPGEPGALTLRVIKGGKPVADLQPYLGAYGHLVALRSGDLAYLHVHPDGEPGDGRTPAGPEISFAATAPSAGTYRLFLDFRHQGTVHTAAFTVRVTGADTGSADAGSGGGEHQGAEGGHRH